MGLPVSIHVRGDDPDDPGRILRVVARGPAALDWLDGLDGYEALLVTPSGLVRTTGGWPKS